MVLTLRMVAGMVAELVLSEICFCIDKNMFEAADHMKIQAKKLCDFGR